MLLTKMKAASPVKTGAVDLLVVLSAALVAFFFFDHYDFVRIFYPALAVLGQHKAPILVGAVVIVVAGLLSRAPRPID